MSSLAKFLICSLVAAAAVDASPLPRSAQSAKLQCRDEPVASGALTALRGAGSDDIITIGTAFIGYPGCQYDPYCNRQDNPGPGNHTLVTRDQTIASVSVDFLACTSAYYGTSMSGGDLQYGLLAIAGDHSQILRTVTGQDSFPGLNLHFVHADINDTDDNYDLQGSFWSLDQRNGDVSLLLKPASQSEGGYFPAFNVTASSDPSPLNAEYGFVQSYFLTSQSDADSFPGKIELSLK